MTLKHPLALAAALLCGAGFLWHSQAQSGPGTKQPDNVAPGPQNEGRGYEYKLVVQPLPYGGSGYEPSQMGVLGQYPEWEIVEAKLVENYPMTNPPNTQNQLRGAPGTHPAMAYTIRKLR
jgi:hypothetical protein